MDITAEGTNINIINIPILFQNIENLNNLPNFFFKLPNASDAITLKKSYFTDKQRCAETPTSTVASHIGTNTIFCINKPTPILLVTSSVNGVRCDFATISLVPNDIIQEFQSHSIGKVANKSKEVLGIFSNKAFINIPLNIGDNGCTFNIKVEENVKSSLKIITSTEIINQIYNEFATEWRYILIEGHSSSEFWLLELKTDSVAMEKVTQHSVESVDTVEKSRNFLELNEANSSILSASDVNFQSNGKPPMGLAYTREKSAFLPVSKIRSQASLVKPQFHYIIPKQDQVTGWTLRNQFLKCPLAGYSGEPAPACETKTFTLPVSEPIKTLSSIVNTAVANKANINIQLFTASPFKLIKQHEHMLQLQQVRRANDASQHSYIKKGIISPPHYLSAEEKETFHQHSLHKLPPARLDSTLNERNISEKQKKVAPTIVFKASSNKLKSLLTQRTLKTQRPYFRPFLVETQAEQRTADNVAANPNQPNASPMIPVSVSVMPENAGVKKFLPNPSYNLQSVVQPNLLDQAHMNQVRGIVETMASIGPNNIHTFTSSATSDCVYYQN